MATETFSASGTFTVPSNVNFIAVVVTGAGGGGGSDENGNRVATGGGGGGTAYRAQSVPPGNSFNVTVGAGGAGGNDNGGPELGSTGGNSSFTGSGFSNLTGNGGTGGSAGSSLGQGGSASGGSSTWSGAGGQDEESSNATNPSQLPSGWDTSSGCNSWELALRSGGGGRAGSSASGTNIKCPSIRTSCGVEQGGDFAGTDVNRQTGTGGSALNFSWSGFNPSFSYGGCGTSRTGGRGAGGGGHQLGGQAGSGGNGRVYIKYEPVTAPNVSNFTVTPSGLCFGSTDGSASWSLSGGPADTVTFENVATGSVSNLGAGATSVGGLGPGTYKVTASNIGGSDSSASQSITGLSSATASLTSPSGNVTIYNGQSVTFSWTESGAGVDVTINNVSRSSPRSFSPSTTTTYTFRVSGICTASNVFATRTVTVLQAPNVSNFNFAATSLCPGSTTTATWSLSGGPADVVRVIKVGVYNILFPAGTTSVSGLDPGTYQIEVSNLAGSDTTAQKTITALSNTVASWTNPTGNIDIVNGDSVSLSWSLSGTGAQAKINGVNRTSPFSVSPNTTTTYTLSAEGTCTALTNFGSRTITVRYPPEIQSFGFNNSSITCPGVNITLSWDIDFEIGSGTVRDPNNNIIANIGSSNNGTTGSVNANIPGTYTLSVQKTILGTTYTDSATTVLNNFTNTVANFDAAGATIKFGETDTFAWVVTGSGSSASINQGIGSVNNSGSTTVTGTYDIIYTLSATGTCNSASDTYNLTVLMFPPDPTTWTIDAVTGQDPAGGTGNRTIYANQFPNLTFNWDYDFSLLGEIASQYIQALYNGTTYEYQVTPNSSRSTTLNQPWVSQNIPYDSTVQFRLRVRGPNDEDKFTNYISISTVGPVTINSFTADPNPQLSPGGIRLYSTTFAWDVSNAVGNPSNISITSGSYFVTGLSQPTGNQPVNNLPQSTAGTLSPATRTFTMNASNPGSTDSQNLVVEVFNDNTPSNITIAPLTQNGNVPIGSLESATEYFTQISFTGTDMPVIVNAGSGSISVTDDLINVSGSILLPAGDGNFFIKYESLPYNNSTVPGGTNSFGEIIGQPNSKTISFSIGSVASSFVITTRPPVIEETFDTEPLPLSPLAYPFPDIDTLSLPGQPVQFAQTPAVPLDDIEIDNEIKVDDPNVQVLINGTPPWKDMREI